MCFIQLGCSALAYTLPHLTASLPCTPKASELPCQGVKSGTRGREKAITWKWIFIGRTSAQKLGNCLLNLPARQRVRRYNHVIIIPLTAPLAYARTGGL